MTDANKLAESLRTMRSSARRHHDGQGGKLRWSVVLDAQWIGDLSDAADLIEKLAHESDFYRRRCEELQRWQSSMRDPERTVVCDILANGHTLAPQFAGDRYAVKDAPAALLTDEQLRTAYFSIASGPDHGRTGIREERLMAVQAAVLAANGKAVS